MKNHNDTVIERLDESLELSAEAERALAHEQRRTNHKFINRRNDDEND